MTKGTLIAMSAAALFAVGTMATVANAQSGVKCSGTNACKGTSACKMGSSSCKGQNACKGQGFSAMTKEKCDAANRNCVTYSSEAHTAMMKGDDQAKPDEKDRLVDKCYAACSAEKARYCVDSKERERLSQASTLCGGSRWCISRQERKLALSQVLA